MHGGTYNSNVVCTAAAIATVEELSKPGVYDGLNETGNALIAGLRALAHELDVPLLIQGTGTVFHTAFTDAPAVRNYRDHAQTDGTRLATFVEALAANGVRTTRRGTWFLSTAHTADDVETTLKAAKKALIACK
jgi:glutamate-1-semialdehyde 2,1-aminomutase